MRLLYAAFLLGCLSLVVYLSMASWVASGPEAAAYEYLVLVKSGDLPEAEVRFGDNTCRCPPKGGYGSLLKYQSGLEPNMAFMLGHPFGMGRSRVTWIKDKTPYLIPWETPESTYVDVPLEFHKGDYQPLFLPLDIAYGYSMPREKLDEWLGDPRKDDWKGFSLRLRPSLAKGTVPEPDTKKAKKPKVKESAQEYNDTNMIDLLGKDAVRYLNPKDAGQVVLADGQPMPERELAASLPRLSRATLRLNVVRRGQFKPWRISRFKYLDAEIEGQNQTPITLLTPQGGSHPPISQSDF